MHEVPDEIVMQGATPGEPYVCDFCGDQPVTWLFGCRDHHQGTVVLRGGTTVSGDAIDDWLACEGCAELVRSSMRDQLAQRAIDFYFASRRTPPIHRPQMRQVIRGAQDQFWANREPEKDRLLQPGEEIAPDAP